MNKPNLKSNKLAALKLYVYICMNRRTEFTFILTTVTKVPKYMPVQDFRATTLYFIEGRLPSRHERRFCLHFPSNHLIYTIDKYQKVKLLIKKS